MGVDPKRPLVGFALVAVLCAVLMTLSVGRGSATDLFGPGKPIAAAVRGPVDRVVAPTARPSAVSIPAELSAQPLGIDASGPVPTQASSPQVLPQVPAVEDEVDASQPGTADRKADRVAGRAVLKLQRMADKAAAKAVRSAEKAAGKAARSAGKAERDAVRLATKVARTEQKAAEKAARQG